MIRGPPASERRGVLVFPPRPHVSADKPAELFVRERSTRQRQHCQSFLNPKPQLASVGSERREHERLELPCQKKKKALLQLF